MFIELHFISHLNLISLKFQIDVAFKKFDQTGNDKLNFKEFCDMMNKRTNSTKKSSETVAANAPSQSADPHSSR